MIIFKCTGGIGNQLFQYANAKSLSNKLGVNFKVDKISFKWTESRRFSLHHFNINVDFANIKEIKNTKQSYIIEERSFEYKDYPVKNNCYISGYFQSPKYFKNIEDIIRREFVLRKRIQSYSILYQDLIKREESVSFNVRRRDYIKRFSNVYYTQDVDYYSRAMNIIENRIKNPHYFVMSDDINWVKNNIEFNFPVTYLSKEYDEAKDSNVINLYDYEDLYILSTCKYHIIGNSTFAWWGAWLSNSNLVISPKNWFKDINMSIKDLIPENWIQL